MSPGQNVTQEVRTKRHPVGQGKMSQGNTSQGKMSPNHSYLFQLYFCAVPLPSALEHFVFECEDEFLCNNSQLLSIIIYYIYLF